MRALERTCTMRAWKTKPLLWVSHRREYAALSAVYNFGIFYHQLIVFDETVAPLPNDWREQHVAQGFAWRPSTVSFATLGDLGDLRVEVRVADELDVLPDAVRAIVVPFTVSPPGRVRMDTTKSLPHLHSCRPAQKTIYISRYPRPFRRAATVQLLPDKHRADHYISGGEPLAEQVRSIS